MFAELRKGTAKGGAGMREGSMRCHCPGVRPIVCNGRTSGGVRLHDLNERDDDSDRSATVHRFCSIEFRNTMNPSTSSKLPPRYS